MRDIDPPSLTQDEIDEGWHYCDEMDGLLANSNDPNGDCFCSLRKGVEQPIPASVHETVAIIGAVSIAAIVFVLVVWIMIERALK